MKKLLPLHNIFLVTGILFLSVNAVFPQENRSISPPAWMGSLKVNIHLNPVKKGGTNHLTLSASVGTMLRLENYLPPSILFQTGVNLYAKGLGTNILDSYEEALQGEIKKEIRRKFNLDWVSALLLNLEWGPTIPMEDRFLFPFIHFNQMTAYAVQPLYFYNAYYGTQFVFNTQHRNQQIGVAGFNSPYASLSFYNDGNLGPLVGDEYDRFWTGGGHLRICAYKAGRPQREINYLSLEYHYDRFTYDVQDGYRLANILLIPNANDQRFYRLLYNNAMSSFKINYREFSMGLSIMGRSKIDIQDAIHRTLGYPLHLTYAPTEHIFSASWRPVLLPSP